MPALTHGILPDQQGSGSKWSFRNDNIRNTVTRSFRQNNLMDLQEEFSESHRDISGTSWRPVSSGFSQKTHWPSTDVDGPSGGHLERNRGLDGSSGGPVSSGFSQNALAVHGSGWTFWRLSSKKPRPLRLFRGTCFRWVQPKRTGCSQLWMDLLAAIFARNRSLIGTHRGDLFSHFQTKSVHKTPVDRKTHGCEGSPPKRTCFHAFSPKKCINAVVNGFSYFSVQKSIPRREKRQKCCILYLLNCGNTIPGGVSK